MFAAMGLSAIVPVVHGLKLYGFRQMELQIGLSWVLLQGSLYLLGGAIYAVRIVYFHYCVLLMKIYQARVPERLMPGSFDVWGSSHQIFHVLIVFAAIAHLVGLLKAFHYAKTSLICQWH